MFSTYECWMLAAAMIAAADRKDKKRMKELDRAEINALYRF